MQTAREKGLKKTPQHRNIEFIPISKDTGLTPTLRYIVTSMKTLDVPYSHKNNTDLFWPFSLSEKSMKSLPNSFCSELPVCATRHTRFPVFCWPTTAFFQILALGFLPLKSKPCIRRANNCTQDLPHKWLGESKNMHLDQSKPGSAFDVISLDVVTLL